MQVPTSQRSVAYCVGCAAFLFQFEAFFVHIALPDMQREMGVTGPEIAQVITMYLLGAVLALLPGGALGRRFGFSKVFVIACLVAAVGTALSACATSLPDLRWFRCLQGIGIGLMVSAGYALIPMWLARLHLGWGFGIVAQGAGLGMILGVPIGGVVAHFLAWRWVFWAQLPLVIGLFILAVRALPADPPRCESSSSVTVRWQRLLKVDGFIYSLLALFLFQLILGGTRYLVPFYLESVQILSSLQSSLCMVIYAVGVIIASHVAGAAADRYGSAKLMLSAYILAGLGCLFFALFISGGSTAWALLLLSLLGAATGLFSAPNNRLMTSAIPQDLVQDVGSMLPIALNLGVMSGVFLFQYEFHGMVSDALVPQQDQGWAYSTMYGSAGIAFLCLAFLHVILNRKRGC